MTSPSASSSLPLSASPQKGDYNPSFSRNEKEPPLDSYDHRPQNGPLLSYLWTEPSSSSNDPGTGAPTKDELPQQLAGQTLYLGAEIGSDGYMYCIPGHSPRVLILDVSNSNMNDNTEGGCGEGPTKTAQKAQKPQMIGPSFPGKFKWLRGVRCGDIIYGIPCHADSILRIHVPSRQITTLPIPYETFYEGNPEVARQQRQQEWKYHGGSICPHNQCLYAIPQSALHVLKIDPSTETIELVGPELPGRYKWYGGIVGKQDGAVYGIPHNSPHVLRILGDEDISLHGDYGMGGHKWHGAAAAPNGVIVSVPANADTVLCIRPGLSRCHPPELFELGGPDCVRTGRHRKDNKYKYLGAMAGTDANVYCFPSGSERVLQINAETCTVQQVGPNLYDEQMERLCQNKWQNGLVVSQDQCVYAIPLAAESVLRIDCSHDPPHISTWALPAPHKGLAKWEGGIVAENGVIYTVPNNHKAILRIEPSFVPESQAESSSPTNNTVTSPSVINDRVKEHEHYELPYSSGIPTLRSSAHRVKYNVKRRTHDPKPKSRAGQETGTIWLPSEVRMEEVFCYDLDRYQIVQAVRDVLRKCDSAIVGTFREGSDRLEDFCVPTQSTWRSVNGGQCEDAQRYLSDMVAGDVDFLDAFDKLVIEVVLPHLKERLVKLNILSDEPGSATFYYQRPPTLRLQPGPAWAQVKAHNDAEYGHQNGELNFWVPLTDREETGVDLWCETEHMSNDFHPIVARSGQIISFHGSSCRHYLNANASSSTRVSLDFRVGVEGFFDPEWEMRGTTDDHSRREMRV